MKLNKKNKLLCLGFFMSLFLCYNFAVSKTVYYVNEYIIKSKSANNNTNNPATLAQLNNKEKEIDKWLLENGNYSSTNFQNSLLKQVNIYSELYHLKIIDFQTPHVFSKKQTSITSYSFSLEGNFNSVLKLLNKFENQPNLGQIKHVGTLKKTNYKNNQDYLVTTIIVEKIENLK